MPQHTSPIPEIYATRLHQKLTQHLDPTLLEIEDESAKHVGHAGHNTNGETHFRIFIVSSHFEGKNLVARHRMIYDAVKDEINEHVHALTIEAKTLSEYNHR